MRRVSRRAPSVDRAENSVKKQASFRGIMKAGFMSPLPSPQKEASAFWKLRWRIAMAKFRDVLRTRFAWLMTFIVVSLLFWAGLFGLFYEGFSFLNDTLAHEGTRAQTVQAIYNIFFLSLLVMLTFSSAIIMFSTLFRGDEAVFLMTTPARPSRVVTHKLQEATFFAGWGFLLLGTPMLIAYGVSNSSPWYYYLLLAPFLVCFAMIPANIGAAICLLTVRFLPKKKLQVLITLGVLVIAGGAFGLYYLFGSGDAPAMTPEWLHQSLARSQFAYQRFLPSWWLSMGLLEAAHPVTTNGVPLSLLESVSFLGLLLANALFFQMVAGWTSQLHRIGFSGLAGSQQRKAIKGVGLIDRITFAATSFLTPIMRQMIVKDLRLFRRDPVQWTQLLIFFSLLAMYFVNIRRVNYGGQIDGWVEIIGFLNTGVVGLILATFTTRFVFPMVSLEGRRMWILGSMPVDRGAVLWGKYLFASVGAMPVCGSLLLLSDFMLSLHVKNPWMLVVHQIVCFSMCSGLIALGVGLGARYPNLREPSPSKIASGFGGTLNLVLSAAFIISAVLITAIPSCLYASSQELTGLAATLGTWYGVVISVCLVVVLAIGFTATPLRIGLAAFRRLEP